MNFKKITSFILMAAFVLSAASASARDVATAYGVGVYVINLTDKTLHAEIEGSFACNHSKKIQYGQPFTLKPNAITSQKIYAGVNKDLLMVEFSDHSKANLFLEELSRSSLFLNGYTFGGGDLSAIGGRTGDYVIYAWNSHAGQASRYGTYGLEGLDSDTGMYITKVACDLRAKWVPIIYVVADSKYSVDGVRKLIEKQVVSNEYNESYLPAEVYLDIRK